MQGGEKQCLDGRDIGQALIRLEAADLPFTIAHCNGQFQLGEAFAAAQVLEQIAKGSKRVECDRCGRRSHGPSIGGDKTAISHRSAPLYGEIRLNSIPSDINFRFWQEMASLRGKKWHNPGPRIGYSSFRLSNASIPVCEEA